MKVLAAIVLAHLGGNEHPTEADILSILAAVGADTVPLQVITTVLASLKHHHAAEVEHQPFVINGAASSATVTQNAIPLALRKLIHDSRVQHSLLKKHSPEVKAVEPPKCVESDSESDCEMGKPVIYIYAPQDTAVNVKISLTADKRADSVTRFSVLYPKPNRSALLTDRPSERKRLVSAEWSVKALLDGSVAVDSSREYPYLYWEAVTNVNSFVHVDPHSSIALGHVKLRHMPTVQTGIQPTNRACELLEAWLTYWLSTRERCDFLSYWLPRLHRFPFVQIWLYVYDDTTAANQQRRSRSAEEAFFNDAIGVQLTTEPPAASMRRVYMLFQGIDDDVSPETVAVSPDFQVTSEERDLRLECDGVYVVEWGATELPARRTLPKMEMEA